MTARRKAWTPSCTVVGSPSATMSLTRRSWYRYEGRRAPCTHAAPRALDCASGARPVGGLLRGGFAAPGLAVEAVLDALRESLLAIPRAAGHRMHQEERD